MKQNRAVKTIKSESNENFSSVISSLIPLAENYLIIKNKEVDMQMESSRYQHEYRNAQLKQTSESAKDKSKYLKLKFSLLYFGIIVIVLILFAFSFGLIFLKDKFSEGILIISHIVAISSGLMAGIGLKNRETKKTNSEGK